jgi:hypothetical protein
MKTNLHCLVVRLALALVAGASIGVAPLRAADDIENLFKMGREAYYKGDLEQAQQLLTMVAAQNPRHQETRILLGDIRTKLRTTAGSSLKKKYEGVKLAKIEFTDVTLQEALEGLRALSKNASGGQVVPNFIVTDPKIGTNKVSLTLTDMPLTTAIDYVAKVSGAKATYDQHAVLFTSAAGG